MKYEKIMIEELEEFWKHVQNNEEPGMFEDKDPNLLIKALEEKKYVDGDHVCNIDIHNTHIMPDLGFILVW